MSLDRVTIEYPDGTRRRVTLQVARSKAVIDNGGRIVQLPPPAKPLKEFPPVKAEAEVPEVPEVPPAPKVAAKKKAAPKKKAATKKVADAKAQRQAKADSMLTLRQD